MLSILTQQVFNFFGQENPLTKYYFQTPAGVSWCSQMITQKFNVISKNGSKGWQGLKIRTTGICWKGSSGRYLRNKCSLFCPKKSKGVFPPGPMCFGLHTAGWGRPSRSPAGLCNIGSGWNRRRPGIAQKDVVLKLTLNEAANPSLFRSIQQKLQLLWMLEVMQGSFQTNGSVM